jgi:hypothetical protein
VRSDYAAGGPRLSLEPRGYVLGQLTRKPDGRTLILHLLNYDHQAPAENVKVRLELNGLVQDLSQGQVKVLSPDTPQPPASLCTGHRRVRPEPDRALYRGDFLAQSRGPRREAFRISFSSSEQVGANLSDRSYRLLAETTKCPRTTAESTARGIQYVELANMWSWPILHQEHSHVGKAPQARLGTHKCPTYARLLNLTIKFPFAPES